MAQLSPQQPQAAQAPPQNAGRLTLLKKPPQTAVFEPFVPGVRLRWDERHLFIESNGIPAHNMMVGITAWQQQVPLPQSYAGSNAWQIPLVPVPSKTPASIKGRFLRGAVAIAANGIPIFNPQNNRGEISAEIGELDQWGGHCGRADDYHYHAAPLHLQAALGEKLPIAYALDGYPLYGLREPDGTQPTGLDSFNGHTSPALGYHYHASTRYPYVNGGFHGEVVEREGQVDPQPAVGPVRDAGSPLRGAKITGFETLSPTSWKLTYEVAGETRKILYAQNSSGSFDFEYQNGREGSSRQTYTPRRGGGPQGKGEEGRPPGRPNDRGGDAPRPTPPRDAQQPPGDRNAPRKNPDQGGAPRKPWLQVHGAEIDSNNDGTITREEFFAEARRSFDGYDRNADGKLTRDEYAGPGGVRSPMGGFIKEHASDIDSNKDGVLTFEEFSAHLRPMFEKQDRNRDGKLTADEWRDLPSGSADQQPPPRNRSDPPGRSPRAEGGRDSSK
jgi:Ca2+-binding EF-hand superfamily protein